MPAEAPLLADPWSTAAAERTYLLPAWSSGHFTVNAEGHLAARVDEGRTIDLFDVVSRLREEGVSFPALIRLQDLLRLRVVHLHEAFERAIRDAGYDGRYQGVFPIKVNQLREVVEEVLEAGAAYGFGLECGSKAELVAALPYLTSDDLPLICNGAKDRAMLQLMANAQRLGKNVVPVLERYEEFEMLRALTAGSPVEHAYGVRVRLGTHGAGLWAESGGENSKFGLSLEEVLRAIDAARGTPLRLRLLHYHLGSQIADLDTVAQAATEGARIYARLVRRGLPLRYLDVGGGLGVPQEAGNPDVPGSIDYDLDAYAHAIVTAVRDVCAEEGIAPPVLISESGRALSAYHSVLVMEVLGVRSKPSAADEAPAEGGPACPAMDDLTRLHDRLADLDEPSMDDLTDLFRAAGAIRSVTLSQFRAGDIGLDEVAACTRRFWTFARTLHAHLAAHPDEAWPPELVRLDRELTDQYLCNFSVFRSIIDYLAVGQRFPIVPLHRLEEPPTQRGILTDLTCDSDGKVSRFVCAEGDKRSLELHPFHPDEPYFLGVFMVGAYQDIMGDMHNLFGRVTEAHVYADDEEPEGYYVEKVLPGASIEEQLALVQYFPYDLDRRMSELIQEKVRSGTIRPPEGVRLLDAYRRAFNAYTYLDADAGGPTPAS